MEHKNDENKNNSSDDEASGSTENNNCGFDCNICLDPVQDPVVTLCGHLYCWPCIYKWIHNQITSSDHTLEKKNPQCPVCKTDVSQNTIVPLYGRGQLNEDNSSGVGMMIPPRPVTPRRGVVEPQPPSSILVRRGLQQRAPPPLAMPSRGRGVDITAAISPSPTIGMLGEMVTGRILGDLETPLFATPNSYNLAGVSTRRARRQAVQADRSLTRIYTFLFCCLILCLLLFT